MFCQSCGKQIDDSSTFCVYCGAKIETASEQAAPAQETAQQAVPQQQAPNTQAQGAYQQAPAQQVPQAQQTTYNVNVTATPVQYSYPHPNSEGMLCAAFVINLIVTIIAGFVLIPLAWMIPMTVRSYGIWKGTKPNTVAFGVCTLIFVNLISGILLLCSEKDS